MLSELESARYEILAHPTPASEPTLSHAITPREMKQFIQNASTPSWTAAGSSAQRDGWHWLSLGFILAWPSHS